jgi:hypothetical protein
MAEYKEYKEYHARNRSGARRRSSPSAAEATEKSPPALGETTAVIEEIIAETADTEEAEETEVSQVTRVRKVGEVSDSKTEAQHLSRLQRAERIARLNEMPPDIPQLVVSAAGSLLVGVLYLVLPEQVTVGPGWLLLVLEVLLLSPPIIAAIFWGRHLPYPIARGVAFILLTFLTLALILSVVLWISDLTSTSLKGQDLLKSGVVLWASNVLVFAVWYWELDGNGPRARRLTALKAHDFRFPQHEEGNPTGWVPGFVDYLFLAFCSATALSPADTMPMTQRAKLMLMAEAVLSMVIIVLLVARSVNIL